MEINRDVQDLHNEVSKKRKWIQTYESKANKRINDNFFFWCFYQNQWRLYRIFQVFVLHFLIHFFLENLKEMAHDLVDHQRLMRGWWCSKISIEHLQWIELNWMYVTTTIRDASLSNWNLDLDFEFMFTHSHSLSLVLKMEFFVEDFLFIEKQGLMQWRERERERLRTKTTYWL